MSALTLVLASTLAFASDTDPIPGADVKVGRPKPWPKETVAQGTTDAHGTFTAKDLPEGTFFVKIKVAGKTYKVAENEAGEKIMVVAAAAPSDRSSSSVGARTSRSVAKPTVIMKSFGDVTTTVEVLGNSIKVMVAKKKGPDQSKR